MKHRLFCHLRCGGDPESERVYRWHIAARHGARMAAGVATDQWKRTLDDYVASATALHASMVENGFDPGCPIPIDPNGELLGGAHRLACALALGIETVPVVRMNEYVWAPAWGWPWFEAHAMKPTDLERLMADWLALKQ